MYLSFSAHELRGDYKISSCTTRWCSAPSLRHTWNTPESGKFAWTGYWHSQHKHTQTWFPLYSPPGYSIPWKILLCCRKKKKRERERKRKRLCIFKCFYAAPPSLLHFIMLEISQNVSSEWNIINLYYNKKWSILLVLLSVPMIIQDASFL